ncbi:hypothetical protein GCM10011297_32960 [Bacterioplanes sanyensis]|uniref:DUF2726 domain-containing protein n=1 Tax=Bacterioplanes sanyensis TaxID=1249553 RepID=UPI00167755E0|nr:DUF2726 domain-containing protein [Bacterioplanes sanyensis]GGY57633.1 hypothetical protein GCM10011297_32960 [Bacterioplanes sanyensis]
MQAITDLFVTLTYWAFGILVIVVVIALVFGGKPSPKGKKKQQKRQAKPSPLEALLKRLIKPGNSPAEAEPNQPSYESVGRLLTPAERSFYGVLLSVVPDDITVMCKVRMADLLRPNRSEIDHRSAFRNEHKRDTHPCSPCSNLGLALRFSAP